MDTSYIAAFVLAGIVIVGALMFWFISKMSGKGCKKRFDVEQYRVKFLAIENQLKRNEPSSCNLAVLNADKLVDQALRESGVSGETMGERMKMAVKKFSDNNGVWNAHKLRNRIAHETDIVVSYDEARYALANFKRALRDLGAI